MSTPIHELERSFGDFPREHQFSTLDQLERSPDNPALEVFFSAAEKLVTQWDGDQFAGLYLYGEPGTGKTHAAMGLARALHQTGATIHYRHVPSWQPPTHRAEDWLHGRVGRTTEVEPHITDWMGPDAAYNDLRKPFPTSKSSKDDLFGNGREDTHDKSVLLLDDYKPFARNYIATAIEAASQYGGLVVITSNYTDPFKILEATPEEQHASTMLDTFKDMMPGFSVLAGIVKDEQTAKRDALRSRVAAGFRFIHFEGEDHRPQKSFWND